MLPSLLGRLRAAGKRGRQRCDHSAPVLRLKCMVSSEEVRAGSESFQASLWSTVAATAPRWWQVCATAETER